MILVDTDVLLDVVTDDPDWAPWSTMQLENAAVEGAVRTNDVVWAELAARCASIEQLNAFAGGQRRSELPDFFIGFHAAVEGLSPLTRDKGAIEAVSPNCN